MKIISNYYEVKGNSLTQYAFVYMKFVLDYTRGSCYNTFRTDYGAFGEMSEWSIVQHSKCCVLNGTLGSNPSLSARE